MLHCQYCWPQIPKYVWDPERNLGLSPSQIHQDHATQCQEECHDGLELEQDHGKFRAVGDYHCHALLGKPDSAKCGLPSCPNTWLSNNNMGNVFNPFVWGVRMRTYLSDGFNFFLNLSPNSSFHLILLIFFLVWNATPHPFIVWDLKVQEEGS